MLIDILLQVYRCNRRELQPNFGCLFPHLNVLPVHFFVHSCIGKCDRHSPYVLMFQFVKELQTEIISRTHRYLHVKQCRLIKVYRCEEIELFIFCVTSYSRRRCFSLLLLEELKSCTAVLYRKNYAVVFNFHEDILSVFGYYFLMGCDVLKCDGNLQICLSDVSNFLAYCTETQLLVSTLCHKTLKVFLICPFSKQRQCLILHIIFQFI